MRMRELKSDRPPSVIQIAMRSLLGFIRKSIPIRTKHRHVPRGPDRELEDELTQNLEFMFRDWAAHIVHSKFGTVVVECRNVLLRADRERDFLLFFLSPVQTEDWNIPDITLAAVTGESDTALMTDRTSIVSLARALEPRMAQLQSAFSAPNLSATQHAIRHVRQAAEKRMRSSPRTIGGIG